jgi:hypothetical protein
MSRSGLYVTQRRLSEAVRESQRDEGAQSVSSNQRKLPMVVAREWRGSTVPAAVPNPLQDPAKASGPSLPRVHMVTVKCEFVWTTKSHTAEI